MISEVITYKEETKLKVRLKDPKELKVIMARKGFSQRSLAKKADMSYEYLNQISNEKLYPSGKAANKIVTALGIEFDDLFFIEIDNKSNH